ncbi:D-alanyl-D-alanine carboxypeptidase PBP3 [Streptococcus caballi]|uniref:D-alanyl-D-alanine carboxypeptidase PBP3 n=1 Tax=Streptococcus caballi TaxID=439220 RepID=UPI00035D0E69|nr:D-alanyl-D-alanine carboxypeptidase PBP3 [Streptococcus caballi]
MKKFSYFLFFLLSFCLATSVSADEFQAAAKHAIAIEATTGKVLYDKDASTPDEIASISKILSIYLVYKEIHEGRLSWDTEIPISDYAYDLTQNSMASNVPLEKRKYTVKELVNASMIASANSATIALAEHIAGTESQFVDKMVQQLKTWGITDAKLVNATGLNNSMLGDHIYPNSKSDDENQMSALDVAKIAQHLIADYPEILDITKKNTYTFDGSEIHTYNYMLKGQGYYREGVDGLKTGTTELAGASFVGTSIENNMRIITVVLDADNADVDDYARFEVTNQLLDYVLTNFKKVKIVSKGQTYAKSSFTIEDGKKASAPAVAASDFYVIRQKNDQKNLNIKTSLDQSAPVAPIKKGQKVGQISFKDDNLIGSGYTGKAPSTDLVSKESVQKSFFLKVWWNHFVKYINEKL